MSDASLENDLRAIEALNQHDVEAALAGDTGGMMSQWGSTGGIKSDQPK